VICPSGKISRPLRRKDRYSSADRRRLLEVKAEDAAPSRSCVLTFVNSSEGTNPAIRAYRFKTRETAMKIAKIVLAGTAVLAIIASGALAQQALTGTVTKVDRINRTVAIRQTQSGTIGANTGAAAEELFKAQDGMSLDTLHAGDQVTFSAAEAGGVKTITKIQPQ
jgi:Cu/Ag efflux protein CusF